MSFNIYVKVNHVTPKKKMKDCPPRVASW